MNSQSGYSQQQREDESKQLYGGYGLRQRQEEDEFEECLAPTAELKQLYSGYGLRQRQLEL
jgi:hypothetical protein